MKKKIFSQIALTAIATVAFASTSFADGWIHDGMGWWYSTNDANTTWHASSWQWLDGNKDGKAECYYFDPNGYVLIGTTTPDGYTVNADGAWTVNGAVQSKNTAASIADSTSINSTSVTSSSEITWPVVTKVGGNEWFDYVLNKDFCSKVASQFVYDNGGYNEWGISNAAVDMLTHTREENKKYGELLIGEEDPEGWGFGAEITYKNGMTVKYAHTNKLKRQYSTAKVYLNSYHYPELESKNTYLFKYTGSDMDATKKNLRSLGFGSSNILATAFQTEQQFDFDGTTYNIIASYGGDSIWGNIRWGN